MIKKIRNRVLGEEKFWPRIQSVLEILRPITRSITHCQLESNNATLSDVVTIFYNLNKVIDQFIEKNDELISLTDWRTIKKAVNDRSEACLKPIHFSTYLLDSRYQGKDLSNIQLICSYEMIEKLAFHLKIKNESGEVLTI